jgi:hypothetical protein
LYTDLLHPIIQDNDWHAFFTFIDIHRLVFVSHYFYEVMSTSCDCLLSSMMPLESPVSSPKGSPSAAKLQSPPAPNISRSTSAIENAKRAIRYLSRTREIIHYAHRRFGQSCTSLRARVENEAVLLLNKLYAKLAELNTVQYITGGPPAPQPLMPSYLPQPTRAQQPQIPPIGWTPGVPFLLRQGSSGSAQQQAQPPQVPQSIYSQWPHLPPIVSQHPPYSRYGSAPIESEQLPPLGTLEHYLPSPLDNALQIQTQPQQPRLPSIASQYRPYYPYNPVPTGTNYVPPIPSQHPPYYQSDATEKIQPTSPEDLYMSHLTEYPPQSELRQTQQTENPPGWLSADRPPIGRQSGVSIAPQPDAPRTSSTTFSTNDLDIRAGLQQQEIPRVQTPLSAPRPQPRNLTDQQGTLLRPKVEEEPDSWFLKQESSKSCAESRTYGIDIPEAKRDKPFLEMRESRRHRRGYEYMGQGGDGQGLGGGMGGRAEADVEAEPVGQAEIERVLPPIRTIYNQS